MIDLTSTPIVILVILGSVGVALPVVSIALKERPSMISYGIATLIALLASIGYVFYQLALDHVAPAAIFSQDVLVDDAFGSLFAIAMLIVAIFTTVGSFSYMKNKANPSVYFSLILLSAIGMVLVAYATDLVMLFVAWELMSIPTYVLVGFLKKDPISNEAAIKYFLFGALSSAIIIYGISLAYGITGSTNIGEVIQGFMVLDANLIPIGLLAVGMFIAGFGFKMGLVPFHMWLPDTYEGAPPTIATLLAAGTKKAGFAAALRVIVMGAVALSLDWTLALGIIAVMTMTVGNIAAIMQKNLARMLAYSSIGHAGYILIGLSIAPFSTMGLQGSLFHILNHAVMKGAAFIAVTGIVTALAITHVEKLKGLARRMPITSLGLVISLLALAGVPPLSGFWSKLMLFGAAIDAGTVVWWGPWLAVAGVLNSALSLAYYGWIIRKMYFEGEREKRIKEPKSIIVIMAFSIIFMVTIGVYPEPIIQFTEFAAPTINAGFMP
ncbi:NADH-quinone oxidoreductase subunit N [Marine Group I thaumarchaeote]|uniref:NADH-quinone oxidoreductase subunit N n=1 Tax=Marine Group I thaumarchaeote TaxID=2511932 RepID=A0A7K4NRB6_9ARCH|nr:NADH-quinone oxidoreductase subunit N [Marine Group I thaumarchaeote]